MEIAPFVLYDDEAWEKNSDRDAYAWEVSSGIARLPVFSFNNAHEVDD